MNSSFKENKKAIPENMCGGSFDFQANSVEKAFDTACRKLSARMRSEQELRQLLAKAGFDEAVTAKTIDELKACNYIDDEKYCSEYFRYAKTKGKADGRIIRELGEKGISHELAQNVIDDMRDECLQNSENEGKIADDAALALTVAKKMLRQQLENQKAIDEKFLARVGRRLASLGYDSGTIYGILGKLRQYERYRQRECGEI